MPLPKRTYNSDARRQQADETKNRIVDATYALLSKVGYSGMTIDAVAKEAGVSPQSVYGIFGSKTGLLDAVIDRARFGPGFHNLVAEVMKIEDPVQRLKFCAVFARQIYDAERSVIELMGGAGVVSPELASKMRSRELDRRTAQAGLIEMLCESGRVKPGIDREKAADILWTLTGRDLYRMMVQECGWSSDRYQEWLGELLYSAFIG